MLGYRDLPALAVFARVARDGSLTRAARTLGVSKSVVSTQLRALEATVGARLLERTTRSVAPTQVGLEVLAVAERVLSAPDEVRAVVDAQRSTPRGTLRVGSGHDLGARFVAPVVARLCVAHPELRAEVHLDDALVDPIALRLDAVVRMAVPADSSLMARRLADDLEIIVAAPGVAEQWAHAAQPRELLPAPWIAHASFASLKRQTFRRSDGTEQAIVAPSPVAVANTTGALVALIAGGAGIGVLPSYMVREEIAAGQLTRVVPAWGRRTVGVYLLVPSGRHPPRRVDVFREALQQALAAQGLRVRGAAG